jgi:Uma2 family endonuclease
MVERAKDGRPATYADLEALPDHLVGEIVGGRLVDRPRPAPRHAQTSSDLGILIGPAYRFGRGGPGGWWILDEPELHLGPDVLVPDLAGWRRVRMPELPETAYFELTPDWICEVISPRYESFDRDDKLGVYRREQVPHAWLVSPAARTLEVLRLTPEGYLIVAVHTAPRAVRAEPFDAVELDLGLLFDSPWAPEARAEAEQEPGDG